MSNARVLLVIGCFLIQGCSVTGAPGNATRAGVIRNYTSVLISNDADRDERLSMQELEVMAVRAFPEGSLPPSDRAALSSWVVGYFAAQDTDKNGQLTLSELVKAPLAQFDCMDTDRNGGISHWEVEAGPVGCPSTSFDRRIGFISGPHSH